MRFSLSFQIPHLSSYFYRLRTEKLKPNYTICNRQGRTQTDFLGSCVRAYKKNQNKIGLEDLVMYTQLYRLRARNWLKTVCNRKKNLLNQFSKPKPFKNSKRFRALQF